METKGALEGKRKTKRRKGVEGKTKEEINENDIRAVEERQIGEEKEN